jgi:hypothetical protein
MTASSARLRDASLAPRDESYTLGRCSEREGYDEQARQEDSVLTKQHPGDFRFAICNIAILTGAAGFKMVVPRAAFSSASAAIRDAEAIRSHPTVGKRGRSQMQAAS